MDIGTITGQISTYLADTLSSVTTLISDGIGFLQDAQTNSEMQFLPGISVKKTADFRPSEQTSDDPAPITAGMPAGPDIPKEPAGLILNDYVAADPIDLSKATAFQDIPTPGGDTPSIKTNEDNGSASLAIAQAFMNAVISEIKNTNFDSGYVSQVQAGIAKRSALAQTIISRVDARLRLLGLEPNTEEMQTLAGYQTLDDQRALAIKQAEAKVENDKAMVEAATRLAEILYQHTQQVWTRALDVAKSLVEFGNAVYQLQIGIERSATGAAKVAMEADFSVVDAEEKTNVLNLEARKGNTSIFGEVSGDVIRSLGNIVSQYEAKVAKFGVSIEKASALAEFDMSKAKLSEEALSERVTISIENAVNALTAFIHVMRSKQSAVDIGESAYSEAIRGALEARNTLIKIGKQDLTTLSQ